MRETLLITLCNLFTAKCNAIDYYKPGDTLWVWAKSGLNVREMPDAHAKVSGKIDNGEKVIVIDYQDVDYPFSVREVNENGNGTGFELKGYWAKVKYQNLVGFVFDAYLSRLPTMIGHIYGNKTTEDFHVSELKKHSTVIWQNGQDKYDKNDNKFVRYIFDKAYIIEISGGSGHWEKEMLFPDGFSLTEGYLIYANTMKSPTDVLLEKGDDYLVFAIDTGTLTIKKVGSFLVIYEMHAC